MNKLELIQMVKDRTGLNKQEAIDLVKLFFDSFTEAMVNEERIEIRGLCSFFIKEYASYTGRNPKSGEKVQIPAKRLPFFKPGKELKERVDCQTGTTSSNK
ncbi:HU family DNA-binding protein [uncultured Desulfobacter sp.]|uniref:HU family DNA-binding protein n=1 Tax=uncultured Desulfobacter sp. TaxID=240139 RepID=UPI0029C65DFD|nr:HU family DNA-binding protein [uncultured Desulfobacter sp.]